MGKILKQSASSEPLCSHSDVSIESSCSSTGHRLFRRRGRPHRLEERLIHLNTTLSASVDDTIKALGRGVEGGIL